MARSWRSIATTVGLVLAGGLAGCGTSGGPAVTTSAAAGAATGTVSTGGSQTGAGNCSRTSVGFTPLTDLGQARYHGYGGGLYPGGSNTPPRSYLDAGLAAARQVRPLAPNGAPSGSGRIVLLSVGMSNASLEFRAFLRAAATDRALTPGALLRPAPSASSQMLQRIRASAISLPLEDQRVMLVNGAFPSFDAEKIVKNETSYLAIVHTDLADAGVTADQVQAIWVYEAIAGEREPFPADAQTLQRDLGTIIAMLTTQFPNLRLVYVTSREYAGYAISPLNPEPYAYESGYAVKWTVAGRMADPGKRPWVAWGPYTWADGTHPRSDGLTWNCGDFEPDGTHPSAQGAEKLGRMMLGFFTANPTTRTWFDATSR